MTVSEAPKTRRRAMGWTACLWGAGFSVMSLTSAHADTQYRVVNDGTDSCSVVFTPNAKTSEDAPHLMATFEKSGKKGLVSIGVTAAEEWEQLQFVHQNQRSKFVGIEQVRPKRVANEPFWVTMEADGDASVLFHLTGRDGAEEYHSTTYRSLTAADIATALSDECGAKGGPFAASEIGSLEEEKSLELKPRDKRHIRWVLNQKYSDSMDVSRGAMTDRERNWLAKYASANGLEPSRYLNEELAALLLKEKFKPKRKNLRGEPGFKRFEDWISYDDVDSDTCAIVSFAKKVKGFKTYTVPRMEIHADPAARGNSLYFDFVTPNRFNDDFPITAIVDGRKIRLNIEDGRVRPIDMRNGFASADIVRAIRRGKEIVIRGTGLNGKSKHSVRFSALGFTAAFHKMARDCNRPKVRQWLR